MNRPADHEANSQDHVPLGTKFSLLPLCQREIKVQPILLERQHGSEEGKEIFQAAVPQHLGPGPPLAKKRSSFQRRPVTAAWVLSLGLLSSPACAFCGYKVPVSYLRVRSMSCSVCCSVFDRKPSFHLTECDITVQVLAPEGQQPLDFSLVTTA